MRDRYFIGLDNGGSVTKAGLFDQKGKEVAVASRALQPNTPKSGYVERDSTALFRANMECIHEVIQKSKISPEAIKAVSVTGHGNGLYLVGQDGKPIYSGIVSTDTRSESYVRDWYANGIIDKILPKTKQNIWAGQLAPILAWFKDNERAVLEKAKYAFPCIDFVRYCLTDEAYGEITNISATGLMNLETLAYDDEILTLLGLFEYRKLLPPIRMSNEICGYITQNVSELTGLLQGTPVAGGLVDFAACPLATGIIDEEKLSITTGTWSINLFLSKTPVADRDILMTTLYPIKNYYSVMEGSMTSASNLEWFIQKLMQSDIENLKDTGKSIYQLCNEMVRAIEPENCQVIFLPYLYGTNVNANAKSCFFGLNYSHNREHMIRAIYEGVVYSTMLHVEKLYKFMKVKPKIVRISGGAANSEEWVQIFVDMLQIPVEVSDAKELGAMGVAMCAAVAVGEFSSYEEAVNQFVKIKYTCYPNPEKKDIYKKKFELYKKLVNNMEDLWQEWNELFLK